MIFANAATRHRRPSIHQLLLATRERMMFLPFAPALIKVARSEKAKSRFVSAHLVAVAVVVDDGIVTL